MRNADIVDLSVAEIMSRWLVGLVADIELQVEQERLRDNQASDHRR